MKNAIVAAAVAALALMPLQAPAQQSSAKYNNCVQQAQSQSGWYGETQNNSKNAPLKGAAGGALGGALIGGMGGGNAGRGAGIGAAFGAVAGSVKRNNSEKSRQSQQQTYYNVLNACMGQ